MTLLGCVGAHASIAFRRAAGLAISLGAHLVAGFVVVFVMSASVEPAAVPASASIPVFLVAPAPSETGLNPIDASDQIVVHSGDSSTIDFPTFTFDFQNVADRAALLFPFLTPGLSPDSFGLNAKARTGNSDRLEYAGPPITGAPSRPPLTMSEPELQSVIDKTWSRRDRWTTFQPIVRLSETYSASEGRLPDVIHGYVEEDALQPYSDVAIRDPRLWTQLGIAADHARFIEFISAFAARHPGTKATTELLFLLDKIIQANVDVLVTLIATGPADQLQWTRTANPAAYELIVTIQQHYRGVLERKALSSEKAIGAYYDKIRLQILSAILQTTPDGYRTGDARFLIGTIYWKQRNTDAALGSWRQMTIGPGDTYSKLASEVIRTIQTSPSQPMRDRDLSRIVSNVRGEWLAFSFNRLRQFGYRFDTF